MLLYSSYSDEQLLKLLNDDNDAAFAEIYRRYWDKLLYIAVKKVEVFADAENIVQDVFLSVWQRRKILKIEASLEGYLVIAVKYRIINYMARLGHSKQYLSIKSDEKSDETHLTEDWLNFEELKSWLLKNVAKLPGQCKVVYLLREEGCTQKEIARRMNLSEKTVENHIGRALKILRKELSHFLSFLV